MCLKKNSWNQNIPMKIQKRNIFCEINIPEHPTTMSPLSNTHAHQVDKAGTGILWESFPSENTFKPVII